MSEKKVLITMKVTPDERELFKQKADEAGLTLTDFIKSLVLEKKVKYQKVVKVDDRLLRELNAWGNNLNQIARKINQDEKIDILPLLLEIKENLDEIKNSYVS
jgi:uncharacterized protein (DUF1778 family)